MRVLIVEEAGTVSALAAALLSARGHEVRSAATGARGIEDALAWSPSVVLVDAGLPGATSGLDVCARLRERGLPVVVLGASDDDVAQRARDAGANAVFASPFSASALLEEIESLARR